MRIRARQKEGRATGVLGTDIDVCYLRENMKWYQQVHKRGAIISEFPTDGVWERSFWGARMRSNSSDAREDGFEAGEVRESVRQKVLMNKGLTDSEKKIYGLMSAEEGQPIDYLVETTGLNSSEVLATLFTLEMRERTTIAGKTVEEGTVVKKRVISGGGRGMHPKRSAMHLEESGRNGSGDAVHK